MTARVVGATVTPQRCVAFVWGGGRCGKPATTDSGFCRFHGDREIEQEPDVVGYIAMEFAVFEGEGVEL